MPSRDPLSPSLTAPAEAGAADGELFERLRLAVLGKYDIFAELGHGGMASVFLAVDLSLDRQVAIKVMSPSLMQSREAVERFRREARVSAALNHPHIIPIFAVGDARDLAYYVMKYIEGRSLDSIIRQEGAQSVAFTQTVLAQIGAALQFAHDRQIVHRDVKPANIMIEDGGWAVIADFGIAHIGDLQGLTSSGAVMGTPHYMSPEQFSGAGIGQAVDQYALGVLAHELLTGKVPFGGASVAEVMRGHLLEEPPSLRATRRDIPDPADRCVLRMLAKDPRDRFASIGEAVAAFGTASDDDARMVKSTMITLARSNLTERPRVSVPASPPLGLRARLENAVARTAVLDARARTGRRMLLAIASVTLVVAVGAGVVVRRGETTRAASTAVTADGQAPAPVATYTSARRTGDARAPLQQAVPPAAIATARDAATAAVVESKSSSTATERAPAITMPMGKSEFACGGAAQLGCGLGSDQFALIPAGTFQMGSSLYRESNEQPVHTVTVSRPYFLQKTEVTQGQWRAVMGGNPSGFAACGDLCPVEQVSWDDIQSFLAKLNARSGGGFRLPTEAEWEYAARAGAAAETYGQVDAVAWYGERSGQTHAVAGKQPNAWGLYDMLGNVSEWVSDVYGAYGNARAIDPTGPATGSYHSLRGGAFLNIAYFARAAYRFAGGVSSNRSNSVGFRLAWSP